MNVGSKPAAEAFAPLDGAGLAALEARLRFDLECLELPAKAWVPARRFEGQRVRDAIFIGAGMCGLAAAARLKLAGVDNIVLYDAASEGREGPWETFARMRTLRSPKTLSGPALGLPALSFRAWFLSQFGGAAWDRLEKIPNGQWMAYLRWYRRVLDLPVANGIRMTGLRDAGQGIVALSLMVAGEERTAYCRHLVLATGRAGLGGPAVPPILETSDRRFWAHSAEDIDFAALAGKRVIVIGAGASAMDNAATALEAGAAAVDMLIRRPVMPRINKTLGLGSPGAVHGMHDLPEPWKVRFNRYLNEQQVPPPRTSTLRVTGHENARLFLDCPIEAVRRDGDRVVAETPHGSFEADFIIAATGFRNDFAGRPEFAAIAPHIRTWGDGAHTAEIGAGRPEPHGRARSRARLRVPGEAAGRLPDALPYPLLQRRRGAEPRQGLRRYPGGLGRSGSADPRHRLGALRRRPRRPFRGPQGLRQARAAGRRMGRLHPWSERGVADRPRFENTGLQSSRPSISLPQCSAP